MRLAAPRKPAADPGPDAGFTLLEIVVALVVLGILLATLTRGTQFGLAVFDRQDRLATAGNQLEAVDRTLRRLVVQLDPGTENDANTVTGTHHGLAFRSVLPGEITGTPGGLADLRLVVGDDDTLRLDWLPFRHVTRIGTAPPPHRQVLLSGVSRIDVDYWASGGWHPEWHDPKPPALIRIRIVFGEGDKRRWPDIVAGPAREQPPG